MRTIRLRSEARDLALAAAGIGAITFAYGRLDVTNPTIAALSYLLVILLVAAASSLAAALFTSVVAVLCFNYFFLPPVGRFTIADPQNWVALVVFLAVSVVASNLSSVARARTEEAVARRDEMARLFDLSRDVLLTTDSRAAVERLTQFIARRFELEYVAIATPRGDEWDIVTNGSLPVPLDPAHFADAVGSAGNVLEFDARARTYSGHRTIEIGGSTVRIVPLRLGLRAIGVLAAAGRPVEPGSLDALGGIVAIAIERVQFLEERKAAELARQSEELKSALLASIGHDLRTPLTAIRVAATNLQASWLGEQDRREQSEVVLNEVHRLTRLFENILDMARLDAGAVSTELQWVHPGQILDAARDQAERALRGHPIEAHVDGDMLVRIDPRLTTSALAQLLENAGRYSPDGTLITLSGRADGSRLVIEVGDRGPGIPAADLPRLFDRFFRGQRSQAIFGTGMGLSIARGLLAVERGQIWAENRPDGGAWFTIAVPVEWKPMEQPA